LAVTAKIAKKPRTERGFNNGVDTASRPLPFDLYKNTMLFKLQNNPTQLKGIEITKK